MFRFFPFSRQENRFIVGIMLKNRALPEPLERIPAEQCRRLRWFFTDIDDTLTTGGLIPAGAFRGLWDLHEAGICVVPVTGRPAGWCDHIARMWPVAGVVGENGAFYFAYDRAARRMKRRYLLSGEERERGRERLTRIRNRVLEEVPGAAVAADQAFRLTDLAIDFREDIPPLDRRRVRDICRIAEEEGAVYKVSSIHVNCWYGEFDKMSCVRKFIEDGWERTWEELGEAVLFIGDSPNDEPLFRGFPCSIGVANLKEFLDDLEYLPTYLTRGSGSDGFEEAVRLILSRRWTPAPRE